MNILYGSISAHADLLRETPKNVVESLINSVQFKFSRSYIGMEWWKFASAKKTQTKRRRRMIQAQSSVDKMWNKLPTLQVSIWKRKTKEETRRLVGPIVWWLGRKHFVGHHLSLCPFPRESPHWLLPQKLLWALTIPNSYYHFLYYFTLHKTLL